MFDALHGRNNGGVHHGLLVILIQDLLAFIENPGHAHAFSPAWLFSERRKYLLEAVNVTSRLLKMLLDSVPQFFRIRMLRHFRQRLEQAIFRVVEIFQLIDIEIAESVVFHIASPKNWT